MKRRIKPEPIPGHKKEKRKKRRWDRKPETHEGVRFRFETQWEVPHITFREKKKKK
jgi:hypothetical protein